MDINLNGDYIINPFTSIEPGSSVGPGMRWATIQDIPAVALYPGKAIYDKNVDILYYIDVNLLPVPFVQLSKHIRVDITDTTNNLTMLGVQAQITSISINHMPYYGKYSTVADASLDYVYSYSGSNTVITFNTTLLKFYLQAGMIVDIAYTSLT